MDELEAKDSAGRYDAGYKDGRNDALWFVSEAFVCRVKGQWPGEDSAPGVPADWESWALHLHGQEMEDFLDGEEGKAHFLRLFGYHGEVPK